MSEQEWKERGYPCEVLDPITGTPSRPVFVELCSGLDPEDADPDEMEAW